MDRMIIYPGAIPLDTDLLNVQRGIMKAVGFLAQACLGAGPVLDGFACVPTVPASMSVTVGPGSLAVTSEVDANGFGSLAADPANLVKMGINETPASFALTAPTVSGQSINYLLEASFSEVDAVPVVLPYYNAANPSQGYAGANNSGSAQNTQRLQQVALQLKAGAAANTGTQATPPVDPGCVAVAVVTVNAGQTTITASSIAVPGTAPFLPMKLPQLHFDLSATRDGWQRLPSGLILQWGNALTATGNLDPVSFPLPFPNAVFSVCVNEAAASGWRTPGSSVPSPTLYGVNAASTTGFSVSCAAFATNGGALGVSYGAGSGFNWIAIGV